MGRGWIAALSPGGARGQGTRRAGRRRPEIEALEGRLALSTAHHPAIASRPGRFAEVRGQAYIPYPPPGPQENPADATTPLTELTGTYKGQEGGLYGGGRNDPPASQAALATDANARIRPLDARGRPAARGKIGLVAIGQSTGRAEFASFQRLVTRDRGVSRGVATVNAAQDGQILQSWAGSGPWATALARTRAAGLSPRQVQVAWIELAHEYPWTAGLFPAHANKYADHLGAVVRNARRYFPNLQIAFISSRVYTGYATHNIDPEPYAYESAFGVRTAIEAQIDGARPLNADPARGRVVAPVMLWGPYTWADGTHPRADGLTWRRGDFVADGVHPTVSGQRKVAAMLLTFLKTDPAATPWFVRA